VQIVRARRDAGRDDRAQAALVDQGHVLQRDDDVACVQPDVEAVQHHRLRGIIKVGLDLAPEALPQDREGPRDVVDDLGGLDPGDEQLGRRRAAGEEQEPEERAPPGVGDRERVEILHHKVTL
jgi:hypothetical protein